MMLQAGLEGQKVLKDHSKKKMISKSIFHLNTLCPAAVCLLHI